jgi:hypothetical protein
MPPLMHFLHYASSSAIIQGANEIAQASSSPNGTEGELLSHSALLCTATKKWI